MPETKAVPETNAIKMPRIHHVFTFALYHTLECALNLRGGHGFRSVCSHVGDDITSYELDSSSEGTILTTNMDGYAADDGNDLTWQNATYDTVMTDADNGGNNTVSTGQPGEHYYTQTSTSSTLLASYKYANSVTTMSDGSTVVVDVYARVLSDGRVFYDLKNSDYDSGTSLGTALEWTQSGGVA